MRATDELEIQRLCLGYLLDADEPGRALAASGLTTDEYSDSAMRTAFDFTRRRIERHLEVSAVDVWGTASKIGKLQADDLTWLQAIQAGNALDEKGFLRLAEELRSAVRSKRLAGRLRELASDIDGHRVSLGAVGSQLSAMSQQIERSYQANRTAENDPGEVVDGWEQRVKAGKTFQVLSGLPMLDQETGGFIPNLNLIVGKPSIGKSALCASSIDAQIELGMRVGIFGLEDGHRWISRRLLARDLKLPVRAVGSKKLEGQEWLPVHEAAARLSAKMKNLLVYKWSGARAHELVRIARAWILNEGVECIWLDNATAVKHGGGDDRHRQREADYRVQVAQSVEMFRDVAENFGVPFVVLCHTTREYEDKRGHQPPELIDVAEGAAFERFARMFIGVWGKKWDQELRLTVKKNIEGPPDGTIGFARHVEQALVDIHSGRTINVREEARKERAENKAQKLEEQTADSLLREQMKKKAREANKPAPAPAPESPAAPSGPAPQLDLLAAAPNEGPKNG